MSHPANEPTPSNVLLLGDDRNVFDHLGLPFYYRHTPTPGVRRGVFWISFTITLAVILLNMLFMPHQRDSLFYNLRMALFGSGGGYPTYVEGALALSSQFYVFALILSGIMAPLLATFSLVGERVSGTMEFLRLAPFSTWAIILGKIFAPNYLLYIVSGTYLALAILFGMAGGRPIGDLVFGATAIVMGCCTLHGFAALFAVLTLSLRGFGAVLGMIAAGVALTFFPMAAFEERSYSFLSYLSPWSALDTLFFKSFQYSGRYVQNARFFGSAGLVKYFVVGFHALLFVLLIWASKRKLDAPEKSALPHMGWMVLWIALLLTALGIAFDIPVTSRYGAGFGNISVMQGGAFMMLASIVLSVLVLIDHPHDRDAALADACERVAGRQEDKKRGFAVPHALFSGGLVLLSAVCVLFFFTGTRAIAQVPDSVLFFFVIAPVMLSALFSVSIECASIGYVSRWAKHVVGAVGMAFIYAAVLIPIIHCGVANARFQTATRVLSQNLIAKAAAKAGNVDPNQQNIWNMRYLKSIMEGPEYQQYLSGVDSLEATQALQAKFQDQPIYLFWYFHPQACLLYGLTTSLLIALLIMWRRRVYAGLMKEARAAIGPEGPVLISAAAPATVPAAASIAESIKV